MLTEKHSGVKVPWVSNLGSLGIKDPYLDARGCSTHYTRNFMFEISLTLCEQVDDEPWTLGPKTVRSIAIT